MEDLWCNFTLCRKDQAAEVCSWLFLTTLPSAVRLLPRLGSGGVHGYLGSWGAHGYLVVLPLALCAVAGHLVWAGHGLEQDRAAAAAHRSPADGALLGCEGLGEQPQLIPACRLLQFAGFLLTAHGAATIWTKDEVSVSAWGAVADLACLWGPHRGVWAVQSCSSWRLLPAQGSAGRSWLLHNPLPHAYVQKCALQRLR